MKFKDWITWIFVRPITKKPAYYKRKDGVITLTVKNCDMPLADTATFWIKKWEDVDRHLPTNLSFAGLRAYDFYWDDTQVSREPYLSETPKAVKVDTDNLIVFLISDKTNARRKLTIYNAEYTYKGKDLVITVRYGYKNDNYDDDDY